MNRLIFELSGPNFDLAKAEIKSFFEGGDYRFSSPVSIKGVFSLKTQVDPSKIGKRLGLTHRILSEGTITSQNDILEKNLKIDLPEGSAAVRTRRIASTKANTMQMRESVGSLLAQNNTIDLESPEHEVLVLVSDSCAVGRVVYEQDKDELRSREVKNRPFFSPVSLEPKYAKAMINLARVSEGDRIHDPFCGTGGILIEGSLMDLKMSGGDIDKDMIEGCKENLGEFGSDADLTLGDVEKTVPKNIDAVVTDPPYGRASSTSGERREDIYTRLFKVCEKRLRKGGHLSTIFPEKRYYDMGKGFLRPVERHVVMVHGSLDRHFCVFRK